MFCAKLHPPWHKSLKGFVPSFHDQPDAHPFREQVVLNFIPLPPIKKKAGHHVTKDNGQDIKNIGNQKIGICVRLLSKLQLSLCGWKFWGHRRLDQRVAPLDRQSFVHRATACTNWKSMSVVVNWAFTTFYDKFKASMGILSSRNMTKSRRMHIVMVQHYQYVQCHCCISLPKFWQRLAFRRVRPCFIWPNSYIISPTAIWSWNKRIS